MTFMVMKENITAMGRVRTMTSALRKWSRNAMTTRETMIDSSTSEVLRFATARSIRSERS